MRRTIQVLGITVAVLLLLGSAALAATPQDIYNDYAEDGSLDGSYTDSELQAYLDDATLHQYGDSAVLSALDDHVAALLAGDGAPSAEDTAPSEEGDREEGDRQTFPFTGFEIMLALLAAAVFVGVGVVLRRSAR